MMSERKRTSSGNGEQQEKRLKMESNGNTEEVQVKLLVPEQAAGAVIGKGGDTLRQLQASSGCKMRMSKNRENYPGTSERVVVVQGQVSQCMSGILQAMEKIRNKVDTAKADAFDVAERSREVKLVVPNTSAGMIIGKAGAYIKDIKEQAGVSIQIFPRQGTPEAQQTVERVITVVGAAEELQRALDMVLSKVAADPNHAAYMNMMYPGGGGGGGGSNSTPLGGPPPDYGPDPYADGVRGPMFGGSRPFHGGPLPPPPAQAPPGIYGGGGHSSVGMESLGVAPKPLFGDPVMDRPLPSSLPPSSSSSSLKFNPLEGLGNMNVLQFLDSLQGVLRSSGFNESQVAEIMPAMQVLAKYNIMGLGLGLGVAAMANMRSSQQSESSLQMEKKPLPYQSPFEPSQSSPWKDPPYGSMGDMRRGMGGSSDPPSLMDVRPKVSEGSSGSRFADAIVRVKTYDPTRLELEIPEMIVGAVLGPRAATLAEIKRFSGAQVEISKRLNESGLRSVVISAAEPDCVRAARVMIDRAINEEFARRKQNSSIA